VWNGPIGNSRCKFCWSVIRPLIVAIGLARRWRDRYIAAVKFPLKASRLNGCAQLHACASSFVNHIKVVV
jgi:hypothetical protein